MVLDTFSYGWIKPLRDKRGETVTQAFNEIFLDDRKQQYLWVDKGKEFYNKNMQDLLQKYDIHMYSTHNEEMSSICERWNTTIKKMWKQFDIQGNTQYVEILPKILHEYNNTRHSSIKMTPIEASKKQNEGTVYLNLNSDIPPKQQPKFQIGDVVRISKYKRKTFDKGYTPNRTEEVFVIDKIQYINPITHNIKDQNGEKIEVFTSLDY